MENLDEEFQYQEKIFFSPKLKSSLKTTRLWALIIGNNLIIVGVLGIISSVFLLYEAFTTSSSYRFEDNLKLSILIFIATALLMLMGFSLRGFSIKMKKGLKNESQSYIEASLKKGIVFYVVLGVLTIIGVVSLFLLVSAVIYLSFSPWF